MTTVRTTLTSVSPVHAAPTASVSNHSPTRTHASAQSATPGPGVTSRSTTVRPTPARTRAPASSHSAPTTAPVRRVSVAPIAPYPSTCVRRPSVPMAPRVSSLAQAPTSVSVSPGSPTTGVRTWSTIVPWGRAEMAARVLTMSTRLVATVRPGTLAITARSRLIRVRRTRAWMAVCAGQRLIRWSFSVNACQVTCFPFLFLLKSVEIGLDSDKNLIIIWWFYSIWSILY